MTHGLVAVIDIYRLISRRRLLHDCAIGIQPERIPNNYAGYYQRSHICVPFGGDVIISLCISGCVSKKLGSESNADVLDEQDVVYIPFPKRRNLCRVPT